MRVFLKYGKMIRFAAVGRWHDGLWPWTDGRPAAVDTSVGDAERVGEGHALGGRRRRAQGGCRGGVVHGRSGQNDAIGGGGGGGTRADRV